MPLLVGGTSILEWCVILKYFKRTFNFILYNVLFVLLEQHSCYILKFKNKINFISASAVFLYVYSKVVKKQLLLVFHILTLALDCCVQVSSVSDKYVKLAC